jgi:hypothetical protein
MAVRECIAAGPIATGSGAAPETPWVSLRNQWRGQVLQQASEVLTLTEQSVVRRVGLLSAQGRKAASDGNSTEACRLFAIAEYLLASTALAEEARLLCLVDLAAADAYLACNSGDYEHARSDLRSSYDAAGRLSAVFGYELMRSHQFHVLNNVIRVEALARDYRRGLEISRGLLLSLAGHIVPEIEDELWRLNTETARPLEFDRETTLFLTSQTVHEVALLMAMTDHCSCSLEAGSLFEDVAIRATSTRWPAPLRMWWEWKRLFLSPSATAELLDYGHLCLTEMGGGLSPLLWMATALDVAAICEGTPEGRGLEREVIDGPAGRYLPHSVPKNRIRAANRRRVEAAAV